MIPRLGFVSPGRPARLTADSIVNAVINDVSKSDVVNSQADFNLGLPRPSPILNQNDVVSNQIYLREQQRPMEEVVESAQQSPSRSLAPALYSPTNDRLTQTDIKVIEGANFQHTPIDINKIKTGSKGSHGRKAGMFYSLVDLRKFLAEMGRNAPIHRKPAEDVLFALLTQYQQNLESKGPASNLNM